MRQIAVSEKSAHRLFVEGKDDLHVIVHLLRRHGLDYDEPRPEMPFIRSTEGYPNLLEALPVAAKSYERVGAVFDADSDLPQRWSQIRSSLAKCGASLPLKPVKEGTVIAVPHYASRVGIWLMPDNQSEGTLESFLSTLVPDEDPCWTHAIESTLKAKLLHARFPDKYLTKAQLHAWLAWQEEPGQPYGTAITAASFRAETATTNCFVEWFRQVFLRQ